jgi:hypothetical protein
VEIQNGLKDIENHMLHFLRQSWRAAFSEVQNLPDQLRKTVNGSFKP